MTFRQGYVWTVCGLLATGLPGCGGGPDATPAITNSSADGSVRGAALGSDATALSAEGSVEAAADASRDSAASLTDAVVWPDGFGATPDSASDTGPAGAVDAEAGSGVSGDVLPILRKVASYQIAAGPTRPDWVNKWTEAVFYTGVMATYEATSDAAYLRAATQWAQKNAWTLLGGTATPPTRSADNQCAGQTYAEIYLLSPQPSNAYMIQNAQSTIDAMILNPLKGRVDWWWCDALFMAPALIARLGAATGQPKYVQFLDAMWADASSNLFDPATGLFWRDSTFLHTTTFWSRGNGWVMAGIARVLEYLPMNDVNRQVYVTLLRTMANAVRPLQGTDGMWRSDLLHPNAFPNPETSGSSLFCFAIAWGIQHGVLDRTTYLPVATAAWHGLVASVDAQGRLG